MDAFHRWSLVNPFIWGWQRPATKTEPRPRRRAEGGIFYIWHWPPLRKMSSSPGRALATRLSSPWIHFEVLWLHCLPLEDLLWTMAMPVLMCLTLARHLIHPYLHHSPDFTEKEEQVVGLSVIWMKSCNNHSTKCMLTFQMETMVI